MIPRSAALVPCVLVLLTGCGSSDVPASAPVTTNSSAPSATPTAISSDPTPEDSAATTAAPTTTAPTSVATTPAPVATTADTTAQTVKLTCTGTGITAVTITRSGDDAKVSWRGTPPKGGSTSGLYVTTFDASGNTGRQLGLKYTDGAPSLFIFNMAEAKNQDLDASDADPTALTFPGAFAGYPSAFHATGAVTKDGADIGQCS